MIFEKPSGERWQFERDLDNGTVIVRAYLTVREIPIEITLTWEQWQNVVKAMK